MSPLVAGPDVRPRAGEAAGLTSCLDETLHSLPSVSLQEVVAAADLQVRTDRKYLVDAHRAAEVIGRRVDQVGPEGCAVLQIDERRTFDYESVYFDTPDLDCYLRHARSRRVRSKVRTRSYLQSGDTVLEVKQSGRGQTEKSRLAVSPRERTAISAGGAAFIREVWGGPVDVDEFAPVITTHYLRSTVLDRSADSRVTIDQGLRFVDGELVRRLPAGQVVVEVKSSGAATGVDHLLWRMGVRPVSMSKFAIGLAATRPWLPANRWHRVLRRTGLRAG